MAVESNPGGLKTREGATRTREVEFPPTVPTPSLLDPATMLDTVEQTARIDAASGMYGDAFLASHGRPLVAEVRIAEQLRRAQRAVAAHRRDSRAMARSLIRDLVGKVAKEQQLSADLRGDLAGAQRAVEEQTAVLRGEIPGVEGGSWADSTALALSATPQVARIAERVGSVLFYLVFGIAELFFAYLAFLLLGESRSHTLGMAAVVIAAVLFLPKQAGREFAYHRAVGGHRHLVSACGFLGLLAVILIGLALLRTTYVFRETTTDEGDTVTSVASDYGLSPLLVTVLWMAVSVGIAAVVMAYSAAKTNPHRDAYRRALIRLSAVRAAVADREASRVEMVSQYDDRVADAEETDSLWAAFEAENLELLIPEAIAAYRHHLARAFADPDITTALEVSLSGTRSDPVDADASRS